MNESGREQRERERERERYETSSADSEITRVVELSNQGRNVPPEE